MPKPCFHQANLCCRSSGTTHLGRHKIRGTLVTKRPSPRGRVKRAGRSWDDAKTHHFARSCELLVLSRSSGALNRAYCR
jgi:hypothetical protein